MVSSYFKSSLIIHCFAWNLIDPEHTKRGLLHGKQSRISKHPSQKEGFTADIKRRWISTVLNPNCEEPQSKTVQTDQSNANRCVIDAQSSCYFDQLPGLNWTTLAMTGHSKYTNIYKRPCTTEQINLLVTSIEILVELLWSDCASSVGHTRTCRIFERLKYQRRWHNTIKAIH